MPKRSYKVANGGQRIDIAIVELADDLSRRKVRKILDIGGVYLNRKRVRVASRLVNSGDQIEIVWNEDQLQPQKEPIPLKEKDVLFENKACIVINKPPGLPSQPTQTNAMLHVLSAVKEIYKQRKEPSPRELTLVHRLDLETSGVIVIAKSKHAAEKLMNEFRARRTKKTYLALVSGRCDRGSWRVENFLSRIKPNLGIVESTNSKLGRSAITDFTVLGYSEGYTLIEAKPLTGRSHQIRVHLKDCGLPIVGDKRYGISRGELNPTHHLLHAWKLEIDIPKAGATSIEASLPPAFQSALDTLKFKITTVNFNTVY